MRRLGSRLIPSEFGLPDSRRIKREFRLSPNFIHSTMASTPHAYEVRPRKDHRGVDLISEVLPFGWLWYDTPDNAIGYAMHYSRSADAIIHEVLTASREFA